MTAPQPNPPKPQYSFTSFQVNNPTAPPPGDKLDSEHARTAKVISDVIAWVGTSLNSDGSLKAAPKSDPTPIAGADGSAWGARGAGAVRFVVAGLALLALIGPAAADMYPDASNAKLPVARTNLGVANPVNYLRPPGPYDPNPSISAASIALVMGSASSPDTSLNSPLIVQKIGSQSASYVNSASILGLLEDRGATTPPHHGTAIEGVTNTAVAYAAGSPVYSFFEGVRGQCNANAGSANVECEGTIGEVNYAVNGYYFIGIEAADNNNTGAAISTLSSLKDMAYAASCGGHGPTPPAFGCGAAYLVNNLGAAPFLCGFCVPSGTGVIAPTGADIYLANGGAKYGIDMHLASFTTAAVILPNEAGGSGYIAGENAAGTGAYQLLGINGTNQATLAVDAGLAGVVIGNAAVTTTVFGNLNVNKTISIINAAASAYLPIASVSGSNVALIATDAGFAGGVTIGNVAHATTVLGALNVGGVYQSNGTSGVSCSPAVPTALFQVANGIVVHC